MSILRQRNYVQDAKLPQGAEHIYTDRMTIKRQIWQQKHDVVGLLKLKGFFFLYPSQTDALIQSTYIILYFTKHVYMNILLIYYHINYKNY